MQEFKTYNTEDESPSKGYLIRQYDGPVRRFCKILRLRDDSRLISEYRHRHQPGVIWPEIPEGIKTVGILEMEIYILGRDLVMIMEVPASLDVDAAMDLLARLPRQQEWEDYMAEFQLTEKGSTSDSKWQPMERMFRL